MVVYTKREGGGGWWRAPYKTGVLIVVVEKSIFVSS